MDQEINGTNELFREKFNEHQKAIAALVKGTEPRLNPLEELAMQEIGLSEQVKTIINIANNYRLTIFDAYSAKITFNPEIMIIVYLPGKWYTTLSGTLGVVANKLAGKEDFFFTTLDLPTPKKIFGLDVIVNDSEELYRRLIEAEKTLERISKEVSGKEAFGAKMLYDKELARSHYYYALRDYVLLLQTRAEEKIVPTILNTIKRGAGKKIYHLMTARDYVSIQNEFSLNCMHPKKGEQKHSYIVLVQKA